MNKTTVIIGLLVTICFQYFAFGQQAIKRDIFVEPYQGKVFNGGDLDPVITVFKTSPTGELTGAYIINEGENIEKGTLSNFEWKSDYTLVCTWKDKYGDGILRILFAADFSRFEGFWGESSKTATLSWSGLRQKLGDRKIDGYQ